MPHTNQPASPTASPYMLPDEVAAYARAPLATVRSWLASGVLPSTRPGRRRLVLRADLEKFLQNGRRDTATP